MDLGLGPRLGDERYLALLESDGGKLAAAAERDLGAQVPSCPGWSVADLVWHIGGAHYFWSTIAENELPDPNSVAEIERPPDEDLIAWFRANLATTLRRLAAADPSTRVWTWTSEKNVAWIRRRMAHETAVHRWDVENATGEPTSIATDLAVDGIDEYLEFFLDLKQNKKAPDTTIHLHATDTEGEWFIELVDGAVRATRKHEKGEVAVRGDASSLLLLLWGRVPEASVEVLGDRSDLFAFLELADLT